jgi:predicted nucleic acid-binding protein
LRVLFDTNVILDLLLDRKPHSQAAGELLSAVEASQISGYVCATTVTTIHYLATKVVGARKARAEIRKLLSLLEVAPVNRAVLDGAVRSKVTDYEDAVICEAARQVSADAVVTRNVRDFKSSGIRVYSPVEMVKVLDSSA